MKYAPLCIATFLFLAACQSPTAEQAPLEIADVLAPAGASVYQYSFNEPEGNAARDVDFASFRFAATLLYNFEAGNDMTVVEAVAATSNSLEQKDGRDRAMAEQALAFMLLDRHLADGELASTAPSDLATTELSTRTQAIVGFAIDLLIRNENPNADLVSAGLSVLKGFWSDAEIVAAAGAARIAAERQIDEDCEDCRVTPATLNRKRDIQSGISSLSLLAMN